MTHSPVCPACVREDESYGAHPHGPNNCVRCGEETMMELVDSRQAKLAELGERVLAALTQSIERRSTGAPYVSGDWVADQARSLGLLDGEGAQS